MTAPTNDPAPTPITDPTAPAPAPVEAAPEPDLSPVETKFNVVTYDSSKERLICVQKHTGSTYESAVSADNASSILTTIRILAELDLL